MQDLFTIRRRPPTEDECKEYARRFRYCCQDWSNYLGDPVFITAEGEEENAESLREELAAAAEEDLVDILRNHGAPPRELVFICHPGTGNSHCPPIYTGIREVSLEGRGSVMAEAFHGAEVHLLDAEGALILVAPGHDAPALGLGETLLIDCNDDYDQLVKGRPYHPSNVEILGYARADRMVDMHIHTESGVMYIIGDGPYGSRQTLIEGTGAPHVLKGPMRLGMHHVGCRKPVDGRMRLVDLFSFHVGRRWEDIEDFTIMYNTFPYLRGRDDWMKHSGGDTPDTIRARHLRYSDDYLGKVCEHWPNEFPFMPAEVRANPEWVKRFGFANPVNFLHADESLRQDKDFVIGLIRQEGKSGASIYPYIPRHLRRDLDVLIALHAADGLFHLPDPEEVGENKRSDIQRFVSENAARISDILGIFPNAMPYATPELLADKPLVLHALAKDKRLVASLPPHLLDDEEVILQANDRYNPSLGFASERLRSDPHFVRRMIDVNGRNIAHAAEWMRRDRSFVLAAADAGSQILQHVQESFTDDEEVMLRVIADNPFSIRHASGRLRADKDFVLRAIDEGLYYECVEGSLRNDHDVILRLANRRPYDFDKFPDMFRDDREVALAAVSADGYGPYLRHCSERLKDDPDIVLAALTHAPHPLKFASARLLNDKAFLMRAIRARPDCLGVFLGMSDADALLKEELARELPGEHSGPDPSSPDDADVTQLLGRLFRKGRTSNPGKKDDTPGGAADTSGKKTEDDELPF
jgi:hypothetical protein